MKKLAQAKDLMWITEELNGGIRIRTNISKEQLTYVISKLIPTNMEQMGFDLDQYLDFMKFLISKNPVKDIVIDNKKVD